MLARWACAGGRPLTKAPRRTPFSVAKISNNHALHKTHPDFILLSVPQSKSHRSSQLRVVKICIADGWRRGATSEDARCSARTQMAERGQCHCQSQCLGRAVRWASSEVASEECVGGPHMPCAQRRWSRGGKLLCTIALFLRVLPRRRNSSVCGQVQ